MQSRDRSAVNKISRYVQMLLIFNAMLVDTVIILGARLVLLLASHRLLITLDPTLAHLSTDSDDDTLISRPATPDVEAGPTEDRGEAVIVQNTKQGLSTASRYV